MKMQPDIYEIPVKRQLCLDGKAFLIGESPSKGATAVKLLLQVSANASRLQFSRRVTCGLCSQHERRPTPHNVSEDSTSHGNSTWVSEPYVRPITSTVYLIGFPKG